MAFTAYNEGPHINQIFFFFNFDWYHHLLAIQRNAQEKIHIVLCWREKQALQIKTCHLLPMCIFSIRCNSSADVRVSVREMRPKIKSQPGTCTSYLTIERRFNKPNISRIKPSCFFLWGISVGLFDLPSLDEWK